MLHELLFALSGHYGGLFKDTGCGIQVVKGVPFISPSEEVLLNRLCLLGTYFRKFTDFKHKHGLTSASQYEKDKVEVTGELHGLYLKSFCHGLDSVLDEYRSELRALESDILRDPHIGPSHLQCKLEEYHLLFPALSAVVEQLETQKAHGCYILEILHKNSASGLPMVKTALRRILHRCHRLLFKQLCAWTLHGMLTDHFREFFIQVADQASQNATESHDVSTIGGLTTQQIQQLVLDPLSSLPRLQRFVLRADLLPSYIPTRVANKILFVGESVQMFQTENKDFLLKQRGPVPREMEARFAAELLELSELEEFSLMRFEDTIDSIRECVAERLWMLVVEDSDLIGHLRVLKDFYLLGRGELYLAFIDQAQDMLSQPPTDTTQHDVNMTYLQAARNVLIADESLLQKFQLTITPAKSQESREKKAAGSGAPEGGEGIGDEGWRCLGLSYSVHWPLHILLTDGVLERYNTVFQFLLAVKRTQLKLQKCWLQQMQGGKSRGSLGELGKWQLRRHMAFLVDNLQYFLQVDVIESSFSILVEKIHTTRDFEAIKLAHDQFVARLLSQAFILMKPVSHCLNQILAVCSSFCRLMQLCDDVMTTQQIKAMENIAKKFQWQSSLLFKLLSSVRDHSASPHLAQLLLRLDYNRYFTTAGGQLGSL